MPGGPDLATLQQFGLALLIGALVGVEREKRLQEDGTPGAQGLRTFILVAETGAVAAWISNALGTPWLLVAGLVAVAAAVVAGYAAENRRSPGSPDSLGMTTEGAVFVVYLLGALTTLGQEALAVILAIATATVLAYKQPLHRLIDRLGWHDVFAGLRLLIATFIVLPFLPNRPVDPWGALNPYSLWKLVLLISSLSLIGYVATRWLGAARGTAVTGLAGGLASSTAVTLSFSRRSREQAGGAPPLALVGGILIAWGVMFVRVVVEVAVVNRDLVMDVAVPFGAMGVACAALAALYFRRGTAPRDAGKPGENAGAPEVPLSNPFSLTSAVKFAAFFALVLLVVKVAQAYLPGRGLYAIAALAGLTDVDAITLSMAQYAKTESKEVATGAIVIAALANTLTKCGLILTLGAKELRRPALLATGAILAAGAAAFALP